MLVLGRLMLRSSSEYLCNRYIVQDDLFVLVRGILNTALKCGVHTKSLRLDFNLKQMRHYTRVKNDLPKFRIRSWPIHSAGGAMEKLDRAR